MKLFEKYLWQHRRWMLAFGGSLGIFTAVFALYRLPLQAILYPAILSLAMFACLGVSHFLQSRRRHLMMQELCQGVELLSEELPEASSLEAADFRAMVLSLQEKMARQEARDARQYQELLEYFTLWAHQIKTPIASMQVTLQNEDSELSRRLRSDVRHIESYVEMVMTYLRLGDGSSDYCFRQHDLDDILRPAARKFAGDFIGKKLTLHYEPVNTTVVTDDKWLSFVVEQVLSNAVKYTAQGGVWITWECDTLSIRDSGMGIAPEDLPRIFEKGYTGFNGRQDKRASGIGLYLCKKICDRLGHTIAVHSEVGEGTTVSLRFDAGKTNYE